MAIYKWNFIFNWDWKYYLLIAQVESLVVELDDLAVKQGEEEARKHQKLIDDVEELRTQLIIAKRDTGHIPREGQFDCLKKNGHSVEDLLCFKKWRVASNVPIVAMIWRDSVRTFNCYLCLGFVH